MLKNAHLLRFPCEQVLRRCGVHLSTPHSSGYQEPCIWAFLSILQNFFFPKPAKTAMYPFLLKVK